MRWLGWRVLTLAMGVALAACVGTRAVPGTGVDTLAGTSWRLAELNGAPAVSIAGAAPSLAFAAGEARASGNGGCNAFNGPYTQNGASLRMGPLVSTRRACADEAGNRQETAFLQALESTTRFSATAEQLALYAGGQVVARLWREGMPSGTR